MTCRNPFRSRHSHARGFTIMEVVIASVVMVLAISSSLIALQQGMRAIDNARYTTLAGQILQSQMEKLRMLSWLQLINTTTGPFPTTASGSRVPDYFLSATSLGTTPATHSPIISWFAPDVATAASAAQLNNFKVNGVSNRCLQSIEIPSVKDGTGTTYYDLTMRVITLTATWIGSDGRSHSLSYTTRYGRYGLSSFFYTSH
jgi:hypothetical protein